MSHLSLIPRQYWTLRVQVITYTKDTVIRTSNDQYDSEKRKQYTTNSIESTQTLDKMSYHNGGGGSQSRTPEPYYNQSQRQPQQQQQQQQQQSGSGRPPSRNLAPTPAQTAGGAPVKVQPLLCSGHTRPVVHLQFSNMYAHPILSIYLNADWH